MLRRNRNIVDNELANPDPYPILWQAVGETMTAENAAGWFYHSGYL